MDNSVDSVRSELEGKQVVSITWVYVLLGLSQPDQPNRAVRTRMLRGVGGAPCEGCPYPDIWLSVPNTPHRRVHEEQTATAQARRKDQHTLVGQSPYRSPSGVVAS